jgi:hypothetical protein
VPHNLEFVNFRTEDAAMIARAFAPEIHRVEPEAAPRRVERLTWRRLAVYYAAVSVVLWGTGWVAARFGAADPGMPLAASPTAAAPSAGWLADALAPALVNGRGLIAAVAGMVSALLLAFPLAYVYVRTRTSRKYDRSLVPTVIVLPVVVTAIVAVVRDNLALAFSLTGIVAAIRFRNTLKESNDAVYIFGAVAIGFAAGIQALGVAAALSVFLTVLELGLWRLDLGAEFAQTYTRLCTRRTKNGDVGTAPCFGADDGPAGRAARPALPAAPGEPRAPLPVAVEGRLLVRVRRAPGVRRGVRRVLDRHAKRWALARQGRETDEMRELEYLVRLRRRSGPDSLQSELRSAMGDGLLEAEWRMSVEVAA